MYATTLPRSNWLRRASIRLAWYRYMPASKLLLLSLSSSSSLSSTASPGVWGRRGAACTFTKSCRNHRNFYINIINWKSENCQTGVNAQVYGGSQVTTFTQTSSHHIHITTTPHPHHNRTTPTPQPHHNHTTPTPQPHHTNTTTV